MGAEFYLNFDHAKKEVLVSFKCLICEEQVIVANKTEFKEFEKEFEDFKEAHRH